MTPLSFQSIADTGTTLMLLPPAATADYYSQVRGAKNNQSEGGYVFPCDSALPDLTVQMVGNVYATIPGHFMNRSLSQTPGSPFCYGGIQQGSPTLSIWGDVFLKSQFAVFDGRDPPRIGFAKQAATWTIPTRSQSLASAQLQSGGNAVGSKAATSDARKVAEVGGWMRYVLGVARRVGMKSTAGRNGIVGNRR
jgi:hypothetical protein